VLVVGRLDEFPKVHISGVILVGRSLAENHVLGSGAVDNFVEWLLLLVVVLLVCCIGHARVDIDIDIGIGF